MRVFEVWLSLSHPWIRPLDTGHPLLGADSVCLDIISPYNVGMHRPETALDSVTAVCHTRSECEPLKGISCY